MMQLRFRRLRHAFWALPRIFSGTFHGSYRPGVNVLTNARSTALWFSVSNGIYWQQELGRCIRQRYSTVPKAKLGMLSTFDILPYILSSLHKPPGPSHCWLNSKVDENLFKADGIFLVLIDEYLEHSLEANQNSLGMFEKAKFLQQRYPSLQVVALQYGKSINLNDVPMRLHQRIRKEYYVFPILLSQKIFEVENSPCHIISKGFQNPIVFSGVDVDLKVLDKAIHDLNAEDCKEPEDEELKSPWVKRIEVFKEPDICSASRNLLFPFPGCISVDENGERVFLSDINQHRIVVSDSDGKILDSIGSSPGFVDGEFDIAKLMRPAASFYDVSKDCLYFVDSENHAIRRADMGRRIVETLFPVPEEPVKKKGVWGELLDEIWTKNDTKKKAEELNSDLLLFPWHLLKSSNDDLYVLNQGFRTLWIIDLGLGQIREVVKESSKILEICGPMIMEKSAPLSYMPSDLLEQQANANCLFEGLPYADLISCVATCEDHIIFCDAVGQKVVKLDKRTGSASNLQFSNFGILGLPFWLVPSSPESYYAVHVLCGVDVDHSETHRLFPGKVDIELNVDIPRDTELVEYPQEGSIWRQARGAAAEVTGAENTAETIERVGIAQQWYDEMESFLTPHLEELSDPEEADETPPVEEVPDGRRVRIGCIINTSLGTSETIIYTALYLRLKKNLNNMDSRVKKAARIADIIDPKGNFNKDLLIKALMMSGRDLEELVFVRSVNVRLKLNTPEHAKIGKTVHTRLVDTSLKVHLTL